MTMNMFVHANMYIYYALKVILIDWIIFGIS